MEFFGIIDFCEDLKKIIVLMLVLYGDVDGIVLLEGLGVWIYVVVVGLMVVMIEGGLYGVNVSYLDEFNVVLLDFLKC